MHEGACVDNRMSARCIACYSSVLALGMFDAVAVLLSAGVFVTGTLGRLGAAEGSIPLLMGLMSGFLISGIAIAVSSFSSSDPFARLPWYVSAVLLASGAVFLVVAAAFFRTAGALCFVVGGLLFSSGSVAGAPLWSRLAEGKPALQLLACVSLGFAAATLFAILLFSLSCTWLMAAAFLVAPLSSVFIAAAYLRGASSEAGFEDAASQSGDSAGSGARTGGLAGALWPVLAGACICAVVLGFMWTGTDAGNTDESMSSITRSIFAGFAFMSLGFAAAALALSDAGWLRSRILLLLPIMAVLPAMPCIVQIPPDGFAGPLFGLLTGVGFAFFAVVLCWMVLASADALRCGVAVVALSASLATAALAGPALSGQGTIIVSLLLFVCYIAVLAVASFRGLLAAGDAGETGLSSLGASQPAAADEGDPDPVSVRCCQLRDEKGLSPREFEVLGLLARGRSSTYIAGELYVSRETVKVHIKHIYEKLGVHSRTELLDLFE